MRLNCLGKSGLHSMLFAYGCLFLSTVIKLNLCVILIEILKTLQVVGSEGVRQLVEYGSHNFIGCAAEI